MHSESAERRIEITYELSAVNTFLYWKTLSELTTETESFGEIRGKIEFDIFTSETERRSKQLRCSAAMLHNHIIRWQRIFLLLIRNFFFMRTRAN